MRYAHRRIRVERYERRETRKKRERERERDRLGRCITLTPRVVTCKCGVKTDVNIRTNGGVAGVRNGRVVRCGERVNELKKIRDACFREQRRA